MTNLNKLVFIIFFALQVLVTTSALAQTTPLSRQKEAPQRIIVDETYQQEQASDFSVTLLLSALGALGLFGATIFAIASFYKNDKTSKGTKTITKK